MNAYCTVRHLKGDFKESGISDEAVYELANKQEMIMVTYNKRDFRSLVEPSKVTIIAVAMGLTNKQADTRITALVKKIKPSEFKGALKVIN